MERDDAHTPDRAQDRSERPIEDMRRRSRHRVWWSSARVALLRGQAGEALGGPKEPAPSGERV